MHQITSERIVESDDPEIIKFVTEEMMIEMGRKLFERVVYTKTPSVISASVEYNVTDETHISFAVSVDPLRDVLNTLAAEYINDRQPQFEVEAETVAKFCNWVHDGQSD